MRQTAEMIEVDNRKAEEVLRRVEQALDEKDAHLIRAVFESYSRVVHLVEDKNTSIRRLRHLFFGSRTEKTADVVARNASTEETSKSQSATASREEVANGSAVTDSSTEGEAENEPPTVQGHGRNGADAYQGATRIKVSHPTLTAGNPCPACQEGTVYEKPAGVFVRFTGNPPLSATIYDLQKLRCGLCGQVFTAPVPQEAGNSKYDASALSMIVLLKYVSFRQGCLNPFC